MSGRPDSPAQHHQTNEDGETATAHQTIWVLAVTGGVVAVGAVVGGRQILARRSASAGKSLIPRHIAREYGI